MKAFYFIVLLFAACSGLAQAQTNTNAITVPLRTKTYIDSKRMFFSNATRQIIYSGNVRVDDPQMRMTCEQLTADFPQTGGHVDHLVALTNVVMDSVDEKGQTNHATSDKATYEYVVQNGTTNEVITLSGHARAENEKLTLYGEPITYDRTTGSLTAINPHTIIKQNLSSALMNTNAPAVKTNFPTTAPVQNIHPSTNAPAVKTNFPPPAIQSTNLLITKTNVPPARIQNVSPKAPRNL